MPAATVEEITMTIIDSEQTTHEFDSWDCIAYDLTLFYQNNRARMTFYVGLGRAFEGPPTTRQVLTSYFNETNSIRQGCSYRQLCDEWEINPTDLNNHKLFSECVRNYRKLLSLLGDDFDMIYNQVMENE